MFVFTIALLAGFARADEQFVPANRYSGILEMRSEATVYGPEVRLRQICQWPGRDDHLFAGVADLIVTHIGAGTSTIPLSDLRSLLSDAGLNMSSVRFAGPVLCTVTRVDIPTPAASQPTEARLPTSQPAVQEGPVVTLKERLTRDLSDRIQVPIATLQIAFDSADEKFLNLSEPQFHFQIEPRRARNLGTVSWEVTATTDSNKTPQKPVVIRATARAWEDQLVVNRPISGRQTIRNDDVIERRVLVDNLPDSPLLTREQTVGQQSAFEVKPGVVMTTRMVQPIPLARVGQIVTIIAQSGGIQIRTVAKAVDEGTFGQIIRVRNEETKDTYEITLTGPQTGILTNGGNNG
ncbi:MAG TPA: flagellar basal body P-ring formation chaperone FlgA [Tepidisphaeraceae bacterium]|nr:flagellar basal body P-ring formation chaperone FlgA [Tepidisphaeraceae bacterium]